MYDLTWFVLFFSCVALQAMRHDDAALSEDRLKRLGLMKRIYDEQRVPHPNIETLFYFCQQDPPLFVRQLFVTDINKQLEDQSRFEEAFLKGSCNGMLAVIEQNSSIHPTCVNFYNWTPLLFAAGHDHQELFNRALALNGAVAPSLHPKGMKIHLSSVVNEGAKNEKVRKNIIVGLLRANAVFPDKYMALRNAIEAQQKGTVQTLFEEGVYDNASSDYKHLNLAYNDLDLAQMTENKDIIALMTNAKAANDEKFRLRALDQTAYDERRQEIAKKVANLKTQARERKKCRSNAKFK